MPKVFVRGSNPADTNRTPLAPTHTARARQLLIRGKAALFRRFPFTIILKRSVGEVDDKSLRLKIDPGSKTTGIAIVNDSTGEIEFAAELNHRGQQIKADLESRSSCRRNRRTRKLRRILKKYARKKRFDNRRRPKGWLPPSLMSRVHNIETWVRRLRAVCPIKAISLELVRFGGRSSLNSTPQKLQNPLIVGVEYQRGELFGYEVWEYLLEKWGRKCVYCGAENVPLEKEHIIPKSRHGSYRVSNLTVSCRPCNLKKGNAKFFELRAEEFGFPEVIEIAKKPLRDAAAVNATRWKLRRCLQETGLSIETSTGGRTKFNRTKRGLPKTHWLDATCVGESTPEVLKTDGIRPLVITANGYGSRKMQNVDHYGFPKGKPKAHQKKYFGFQTGDIVSAVVTGDFQKSRKKIGSYIGRVAVRASGSFNITTAKGRVQGIGHRYCRLIHQVDGYNYA